MCVIYTCNYIEVGLCLDTAVVVYEVRVSQRTQHFHLTTVGKADCYIIVVPRYTYMYMYIIILNLMVTRTSFSSSMFVVRLMAT